MAPVLYDQLPEGERSRRAELTEDICVIDGEHFFIRANINLPIVGTDKKFTWLVWVSLSRKSMGRVFELWEHRGRETEPPYFGWLSSSLPGYPSTLNLATNVHTSPVGVRPRIEVEPSEHPLSQEQRDGITWARVLEFNAFAEHGPSARK
jgi:hypothetical protein